LAPGPLPGELVISKNYLILSGRAKYETQS